MTSQELLALARSLANQEYPFAPSREEAGHQGYYVARKGDDGSIWLTETWANPNYKGITQPIFFKDGVYYAPFDSSIRYSFAREAGYWLVAEYPNHHELVGAWDADGHPIKIEYFGRFHAEMMAWYNAQLQLVDLYTEIEAEMLAPLDLKKYLVI